MYIELLDRLVEFERDKVEVYDQLSEFLKANMENNSKQSSSSTSGSAPTAIDSSSDLSKIVNSINGVDKSAAKSIVDVVNVVSDIDVGKSSTNVVAVEKFISSLSNAISNANIDANSVASLSN